MQNAKYATHAGWTSGHVRLSTPAITIAPPIPTGACGANNVFQIRRGSPSSYVRLSTARTTTTVPQDREHCHEQEDQTH
jgi:hypothetical protein